MDRESLVIMSSADLRLLSPRDVAEILGIHRKTVHLWLRTGKLEGIKISYRSWRISKSALEAFLDKKRNTRHIDRDVEAGSITPDENASQNQDSLVVKQSNPAHINMKFYIREIMGEGADGENQKKEQF